VLILPLEAKALLELFCC